MRRGVGVFNLLVLIAVGVMLADMLTHVSGTNALFSGLGNMWKIGVNGMLGKTS